MQTDLAAIRERLELATEFTINQHDEPHKWVLIRKCIGHRMPFPVMWKVLVGGWALAKDGELEWEPQPSSRDEEFYARCRFETFEEALTAARAALLAELEGRGDGNE